MDVSLKEICSAIQGELSRDINEDLPIHEISTDSRALDKADIFFALVGKKFDGHDFIKDGIEKGVRFFVISNIKKIPSGSGNAAYFIRVADTLKAYGDLARFYRQKFKIPAIAITGSSGKTTVKELTAHLLFQKFKVLKNRGTENNMIGVPKTIFQLEKTHEVLVLEMGTSFPGEIERLSSIIAPQVGMVTVIGLAHLEGLINLEGVKTEKLKVLNSIERGGILILNGQDPMLADVTSGVHKIVRVGFSKEANDIWAEQIWCHETGSTFYLNGKDLCETPLIGRHNVLNCLFAIQAALSMGVEMATIQKGLSTFKPVAGRLAAKTYNGVQFLDDSYNSNPSSFKASLETLKEIKMRGRKIVLCGDMLELGDQAETLHREMGALIADWLFDLVIATGPLCKFLVDEALKKGFDRKRIFHAEDSLQAGKICKDIAQSGDMVLIKGSRGMKMEKVFECFITSSTH